MNSLPEHDAMDDIDEESRRRRRGGFLFSRLMMSLVTLAMLVAIGAYATSALLTDRVTMAAISTEGGTLDIKVNSSTTANQDGPNANWGTFTAALTNMKPGDTRFADITLHNPGTLPATVTASTVGADTHGSDLVTTNHCFAFYFRERAATADVQSIGNGTDWGTAETNAGVTLFETTRAAASGQLYDDGALRTDNVWEVADSRVYRLTVRMLDGCRQGSGNIDGITFGTPTKATGTLTFTFDATQTAGSAT